MRSDTSTPTTRPGAAARAASRVVSPVPQPMSSDLVTGADPVGGTKVLVVSAQLGVVEVQAARRGHRRDAMDWGGAASAYRDRVTRERPRGGDCLRVAGFGWRPRHRESAKTRGVRGSNPTTGPASTAARRPWTRAPSLAVRPRSPCRARRAWGAFSSASSGRSCVVSLIATSHSGTGGATPPARRPPSCFQSRSLSVRRPVWGRVANRARLDGPSERVPGVVPPLAVTLIVALGAPAAPQDVEKR